MVMVAVTSIYGLDPWVHDFYLLNNSIIIIFFLVNEHLWNSKVELPVGVECWWGNRWFQFPGMKCWNASFATE